MKLRYLSYILVHLAYIMFVAVRKPAVEDEYAKSLRAVQVRLSPTSVSAAQRRDSVLSSLDFYTRSEELDEHFCLSCNEGDQHSCLLLLIMIAN